MGSIRAIRLHKLFVVITSEVRVLEQLEARLADEYGPIDHRLSVIPDDDTIHRAFLSFERLIETERFPEIKAQALRIEEAFPSTLVTGFIDNRRVTVTATTNGTHRFALENDIFVEEIMQFKNGSVEFLSFTHNNYQSQAAVAFFLTGRRIYRDQLRSMCLLSRR